VQGHSSAGTHCDPCTFSTITLTTVSKLIHQNC